MTTVTFSLESTRFDEDYRPRSDTRTTTNFANLARGENREQNLRNTLRMIDSRFNELAHWGNENGDRYSIELDIVSVSVAIDSDGEVSGDAMPLFEVLQTTIVDQRSGERVQGIVGNNFSSYVRDYDFSVLLPARSGSPSTTHLPDDFGVLHGNLFKAFLRSDIYAQNFSKPPVICLSVSTSKTYQRTENRHPVLGVEYRQSEYSQTDSYFGKMGSRVRFFLPPNSKAPLAFYHFGDLLGEYSDLELAATIGTMETFQKIYRPEIYNANTAAGASYQPSLANADYSPIPIAYDREERSRLGLEQGRFAEEHFVIPHKAALEEWSKDFAVHQLDPQGERS
ncbi:hypothetical protein B7R54_15015 [Subtercola boreus]|uniref:DUF1852 domain-containing protein n=1 Tax=Subtercola boreus TaxID=120213 RepID=A0A3E0VLR7_9MICO|nr:putative oxygenase MesX [Subtercola boreus]RFA10370.1 hypothetical protein B7R54_15015 [Subtercola boreus]TQL56115.1 uncharacterized protein DUF1852 [Subtercola boreus]